MHKTLVALLLLLPSFSFAGEGERPCYEMDSVSCEVFHLTNQAREKNGFPELRFQRRCHHMAQDQSDDMVQRDYFSHTRPAQSADGKGETFSERAARYEISWAAENIANTRGGAARAVAMWMNSPGHRRNMLNPKYNAFAVGYRDGRYTQVFTKE